MILTGFSHDADGDRKMDLADGAAAGSGPADGRIPAAAEDQIAVSLASGGKTVTGSALIRWNTGEMQWLEDSYPKSGTGVIRVIDPDMNLNPEAADSFEVGAWSDSDALGTDITVTETNEATGIFEGTVFFTSEKSSGNRLMVADGDTVTAEYEDHTLPSPSTVDDELDITAASTIGTTVPPLERVSATTLRIVDTAGNSVDTVTVNRQVHVSADIANGQDVAQPYAYVAHVKDKSGRKTDLGSSEGTLLAGQSSSKSLPWTPAAVGTYTVTAVVQVSANNPTALSPQVEMTVTAVADTSATALEKVSATNLRITDASGNSRDAVPSGQRVQVAADIANGKDSALTFAYMVHVQDAGGNTVSLESASGALSAGQSSGQTLPWTPTEAGRYTVTAFAWKSAGNPSAAELKTVADSLVGSSLPQSITVQVTEQSAATNKPAPSSGGTTTSGDVGSPGTDPEIESLRTDKVRYVTGDTITISGKIKAGNLGTPLTVQVSHGGLFVHVNQISASPDRTFTHSVPAQGPSWSQSGEYKARVSFGGDTKETTFSFTASKPETGQAPSAEDTPPANSNPPTPSAPSESDDPPADADPPAPPPEPDAPGIPAPFVDPEQDPQHYIDRYDNEPAYREWFDDNYPEYESIYHAAGVPEPLGLAPFVDPEQGPQHYIDRYDNEPAYREWFDDNYPEYESIYRAVGVDEPSAERMDPPPRAAQFRISSVQVTDQRGEPSGLVPGSAGFVKVGLESDSPVASPDYCQHL